MTSSNIADGQGVRPGDVREANVGDAGADPEPLPGSQGREESAAVGADAKRLC